MKKGKKKQEERPLTEEERLRLEHERRLLEDKRKREATRGCVVEIFIGLLEMIWVLIVFVFKVISYPFRVILKIINFFD